MKRYKKWFLRHNGTNTEVDDKNIFKGVSHMIKCTSVRRHSCGIWAIVRSEDVGTFDRPVFALLNASSKTFEGMLFPLMYSENDSSMMDNIIDSMEDVDATLQIQKLRSEEEPAAKRHKKKRVEKMTISITGPFCEMQPLMLRVNDVIRGSSAQMMVLNN